MEPTLSPLLQNFVRAKNGYNARLFVSCFTEDAVVSDDGNELEGHAAIGAWIEEANKKYKLTLTPTDVAEDGDETVLTATVSGDFDGSPVEFQYHMTLRDGKIAALAIRN